MTRQMESRHERRPHGVALDWNPAGTFVTIPLLNWHVIDMPVAVPADEGAYIRDPFDLGEPVLEHRKVAHRDPDGHLKGIPTELVTGVQWDETGALTHVRRRLPGGDGEWLPVTGSGELKI